MTKKEFCIDKNKKIGTNNMYEVAPLKHAIHKFLIRIKHFMTF